MPQGISLRTGCFCNPGAGETAEGITEADVRAALELDANMNLARFLDLVTSRGGKSAGAIRVSLGLVSNFADAYRFIQFAESLRDQTRLAIGSVTCDIEAGRVDSRRQLRPVSRSGLASVRRSRACDGHRSVCTA